MSKLLSCGDSFTWGNELPDCSPAQYSKLTWAALLANKKNLDYHCVAKPGSGNHTIMRRTINYLDKNKDVKFVAIMWSFPVRQEIHLREDLSNEGRRFYYLNDEIDSHWINLTQWSSASFEEKISQVGSDNEYFIEKIRTQTEFLEKNNISSLAKHYFDVISSQHNSYTSLTYIYTLQSYLKDNNIPYVFTAATDQVFQAINSDSPFAKMIDKSKWIGDTGFYDWAKNNGYPLSPMQHPAPEAHKDWLEKYLPNV